MEITQVYAIAAGSVFLIVIFVNLRPYITQCLEILSLMTSKYLVYPQIIHRHRYLGPWSLADVLLHLIYITVNVLCVSFKASSIWIAGLRAANLSLINIIPLFAGPHLSFIADLLGVYLSTFQRLHRVTGIMSSALLVFHVLTVVATQHSFPLRVLENMWGLIVSSLHFLYVTSYV